MLPSPGISRSITNLGMRTSLFAPYHSVGSDLESAVFSRSDPRRGGTVEPPRSVGQREGLRDHAPAPVTAPRTRDALPRWNAASASDADENGVEDNSMPRT